MKLYGFAGGDPVNFSDPFGLLECDKDHPADCKDHPGRILGAGCPAISDACNVDPASIVPRAVGAAIGVAVVAGGAGAAAVAARVTAAGATGLAAGGGLTGKIVDALEGAGPGMSPRVNAVLGQVPRTLTTLMTYGEDGTVTIQGGSGSNLRQIILNSDGSSVVKAFDAGKNVWNVVKEIKPQ